MFGSGSRRGDISQRHESRAAGDLRQLVLVRVSDDQRDALDAGELGRSALRIAAGDHDAGLWIGAMNASNRRARILIGAGGDGASIQYNDFGFCRSRGSHKPNFAELSFNRSAVCLSGATAEVFHIKTAHGSIIWAIEWSKRQPLRLFGCKSALVKLCVGPQAAGRQLLLRRQLSSRQRRPVSWFGSSTMMKRRILIVDDELAILLTLKAILEMNGFEVETAGSAREAEEKLRSGIYQMVITDMRMEGESSGFDVIRAARSQSYKPATAILTAFPELGGDWNEQGAQSLLVKPMNIGDLLRQIEALLVTHQDSIQKPQPAQVAEVAARPVRGAGLSPRRSFPRAG